MNFDRYNNTLWQLEFTDPSYVAGDTYKLYIFGLGEYTVTPSLTPSVELFVNTGKQAFNYSVVKTSGSEKIVLIKGVINVLF